MIPLSVPHIRGNEWKYIKECLDTEWVSSAGKYVDRFEKDICDLTGAKYAIACVNGTAALQVALCVIGVTSEDEVLVPTVTFIAPINAVRYLDASPVFMDCDDYYTIDANKVCQFIRTQTIFKNGFTYNKNTQKKIVAIIIVHVFGNAVNLFDMVDLCKERNIKIVEDAAESIGTYYTQKPLTNRFTGTIGEIGCYSFNGNKIITTGGGGMVVTNNPVYAERVKYLTTQAKDDEMRYIHHEVGYNFRLTNIQAALGVAQLECLNEYIQIKKKNFYLYQSEIEMIPGLKLAGIPSFCEPNYWFYCLQVEKEVYGRDRDGLIRHFQSNGIQTRPVWYLNHLQKPYVRYQSYRIEKALELLENTINLPCSVGISTDEIQKVIEVMKDGRK